MLLLLVGARRGLLLRGGDVLEKLATVNTLLFDKTGTLTHGTPSLTQVLSFSPQTSPQSSSYSPLELLALAASVESTASHPIARAIIAAAQEKGCQLANVQGALTVPGKGVLATLGGRQVAVGERAWVERVSGGEEQRSLGEIGGKLVWGQLKEERGRNEVAQSGGETVVYIGVNGEGIVGSISAQDSIRYDAVQAIDWLRKAGLKVGILSGDGESTVRKVGAQLGMNEGEFQWRLTPEEKAEKVSEVQGENEGIRGGKVGFVGDGINDCPALAVADVGVAMGTKTRGRDGENGGNSGGVLGAASDTAGVVLMKGEIWQVVEAVDLARATLGRVQGNLMWALGYNCLAVPVAAGALLPEFEVALTPAISGGLMALSSLIVVGNSLTLKLHKFPQSKDEKAP